MEKKTRKPMSADQRARKAVYAKAYYALHGEHLRAYSHTYRTEHPEHTSEYNRTYRLTHLESIAAREATYAPGYNLAKDQRYRANSPEKARAKGQRYAKRHPERRQAQHASVRAKRRNVGVRDFTAEQWTTLQSVYNHCCAYCGKNCKGKLTRDHITPISQGGNHTLSNIVPACRSCNSKKSTRPPLRPVQPLLL